jgi:uncharacterized protein (TIGR02646 family)
MIHVRRTQPGPDVLQKNGSAGKNEIAAAIAFFRKRANRDQTYDFKAYKLDEVKAALHAMFHGKCAYCESQYIATAPVDVEHFRPKGAVIVDGKLRKPAYYWLAAEWENLLPSCIDCNRKREQELQDGATGSVGKANFFPLADEKTRAKKPGDEAKEKVLLLDPCKDEPSEHLEFRVDGWVIPRVKRGKTSPRGDASIQVFGLARAGLVLTRAERAKVIEKDLETLRRQIRLLDRYPNDPDIATELQAARDSLLAAMEPKAPYSAMARQIIEPVLRELEITL